MFLPVIGLEVHLQVKTKSKMFCRCSSDYFSKAPNTHTCPVCLGLPGALPVPNKAAFDKCVKLALALDCKILNQVNFDRKNYFYPDLPKGYQISQFDKPIGKAGYVEFEIEGDSRRIRVQRVHLEEDTAKSLRKTLGETLLDYNKSGIPLIEIVTLPDFMGINEVVIFAKRLRQIVRYTNTSDAEMQKGQMRFELNISVKHESMPPGILPDYKVEIKNIGSISVLEKVLNYEYKRQTDILKAGKKIKSQTRGLKVMSGETVFQRYKETSDDYRYFPEPDIPPINITDSQIKKIKDSIQELPHERKARYLKLGIEDEQADILVEDSEKGDWSDVLINIATQKGYPKKFIKDLIKWVIGDLTGHLERRNLIIKQSPVAPEDLIHLQKLIDQNKISGTIAKQVINQIFEMQGKKNAKQIVLEQNLAQITDPVEVAKYARRVIEEHPKVVSDVEKNPNAVKFLVGQVMRLSKGKTNPKVAESQIRKLLK